MLRPIVAAFCGVVFAAAGDASAGLPDSIPAFPTLLERGFPGADRSDSAGFSVGAGAEPVLAVGNALGTGFTGRGGWGGVALLEARARNERDTWRCEVKGQYRRIPGVTGPWHQLAYDWGVFDGWGRANTPSLNAVAATRFEGRIAHAFSPSMEVEAGILARHWGHGWRSVWWDQAAAPMPQIALHVDAGRVRYTHTIGYKRHWFEGSPPDIPGTDPDAWAPWQYADRSRSWLAAHAVTADLGRGFQGTLFGAVTWLAVDSGIDWRFEPAYAVPFVAFRPTEYRLGSADNALIGVEGAWRSPDGRWLLSTQWLFDEWVTREVFSDRGWWANKWASVHTARWHRGTTEAVLERCAARPYTYSHAAVETSWTHDRSPIGHPLGANFIEWRAQVRAEWGAVRLQAGATHVRQGVDDREAALVGGRSIVAAAAPDATSSVGMSPLLPYTLRPEEDGIGALYAGPDGATVKTWRVFADADWGHERLGTGRVFIRAAGRWAESGDQAASWGRLEVGLRVQPALEERDW